MSALTLGLADLFSLASAHDCVIEGPGHRQNANRPAGSRGSTGFHFFCFLWSFSLSSQWPPGT